MPGRKVKIETGQYYHIFNRGVAKLPTFTDKKEYSRFVDLISYYRYKNTPLKYSAFMELPLSQRNKIYQKLKYDNKLQVEIHTFKLMPNHFHFTLRQVSDNGIAKFIANAVNSYTKYVNTKEDRVGPLFQGKFKAVLIESPEYLMHLSRYHHLNIYAGQLVNTIDELLAYPYSSLPDYIGNKLHDFVTTEVVLSYFKNKKSYLKFVLQDAENQKKLARAKKPMPKKLRKLVPAHLRGG